MPNVVIGLVGEKASGKGTFSNYLDDIIAPIHIAFSDILFETLNRWGISTTRENLQNLSIAMDKAYGKGTLTNAVKKRVDNCPKCAVVILDGIRWESDVEMLRNFPDNTLVYITANQKIRFERARARKAKKGEAQATFEQFVKEEQALTELLIPKIGAIADFKIENNGSLYDFKEAVLNVYEKIFEIK